MIEEIRNSLKRIGNETIARNYKKYLKSPYEFYGIRVPELRKIAKDYRNLKAEEVFDLFDLLWNSGNHEEMSLAIFALQNYKKSFSENTWNFLISRLEKAKTWDHVDSLSSGILGIILEKNSHLSADIKKMSESGNFWIRRTAIVSTFPLIKKMKFDLTFRLAEKLCYDKDIYVQKGAGWMLREIGKKNRFAEREFVLMHLDMKPYAFSYAIEKMKELREMRKEFLKKKKDGGGGKLFEVRED